MQAASLVREHTSQPVFRALEGPSVSSEHKPRRTGKEQSKFGIMTVLENGQEREYVCGLWLRFLCTEETLLALIRGKHNHRLSLSLDNL